MTTRALCLALFTLLTLAGCGLDIGNGSQHTGQSCFQESDCSAGLTCSQRVCVPMLGSGYVPDAGNNQNNVNNNPLNNPINNPINNTPDMGPNNRPDMPPPPCVPGESRCAGPGVVQYCLDNGEIIEERCPPEAVCEAGDCLFIGPDCFDNDGDGYGDGCPLGFDCDDGNPRINPGVRESCGTRQDDNCNGQINEGCDPGGCCMGGCGPDAFCNQFCDCQPYDPNFCEYQNQPCLNEGDFANGFYCIAFNPNEPLRCWGICDINSPNPDATCPDPGSVCAFDAGDGQSGICMSPCINDPATGLGSSCATEGLGCLNVDVGGSGDGICVPINPDNDRGDNCDPDYFFDCDEGLICLQGQFGRGRCREACRPYFWTNTPGGTNSDCDQGHCLPFSEGFGVCFNDNNSVEGENCAPQQTACNEDAVGCYDVGDGQECTRICRLGEGDNDCAGTMQSCVSFDPQQTELGVCL